MNEKPQTPTIAVNIPQALTALAELTTMLAALQQQAKQKDKTVSITAPQTATGQFCSAASDTIAAIKSLNAAVDRIIQTERLNQQTKNIFDALKSDGEIFIRTLTNSTVDLADIVDQFNRSGIRTTPPDDVPGDEWKQA